VLDENRPLVPNLKEGSCELLKKFMKKFCHENTSSKFIKVVTT